MLKSLSRLVALTTTAAAALTVAPALAESPSQNFTGLYIGGSAGYAWTNVQATDVQQPYSGYFTNYPGDKFSTSTDGGIFGGHVGYQHQFRNWVAGIEFSASGTDLTKIVTSPFYPSTDSVRFQVQDIIAVTGRLGYTRDRTMFYVKGGYAGGNVRFTATTAPGDDVTPGVFDKKAWQNGWTIGAGVDHAIFKDVLVGVDYTYTDLGTATHSGSTTYYGYDSPTYEKYRTKADIHAVTARITFLLTRPSEVVPLK